MRRPLAEDAEVIDAGDEAAAEEVMPNAVDEDARGERIRRISDFLGEFQTAARLRRKVLLRSGDGFQKSMRNRFSGCSAVAADEEQFVGGIAVEHGEGGMGFRLDLLLQFLLLLEEELRGSTQLLSWLAVGWAEEIEMSHEIVSDSGRTVRQLVLGQ
jgi:hypothetical protein